MASAPALPRSRLAAWLMATLLVVLTVAAYQPVWHAGFIWDDDAMITANPPVKAGGQGLVDIWSGAKFHDYVPLTSTTFWLEWRLWGENALGYHLVNVLLHALSAVLLWQVLKRLRIPGAGLAAAIFAVHPANVESVAWVAERKNTLAMFFYLLSLLLYLRASKDEGRGAKDEAADLADHAPRPFYYGLSLAAFALALLSKTAGAPLPLVLLGLAWWQHGRIGLKDVWRSVPFFALAVTVVLVVLWCHHRVFGAGMAGVLDAGFWSRLAGAGWAVWFYLSKALLPLDLIFVYPRWRIDPALVLSYTPGLLLALGFAVCWRFRATWGRAVLFGLGYFVVMLLPIVGFVNIYFMRYSLVADHWQYFAIIGPIALVASALATAGPLLGRANRHLRVAPGGALILVLGVLTWKQSHIYTDQVTSWHDTLARNPACWMAHINLGNILAEKGQINEAIRHFQEALRLQPDNVDAHSNLGNSLLRKGQTDEAIRQFQEALRLQSNHINARYSLAVALEGIGQTDEAIRQYQETVRLKPDHADARGNLGILLIRKGQIDEAIRQFQEAARLQPDNAEAHSNLAAALATKGRFDEAISQFQEALRLKPNDPGLERNLARAHQLRSQRTGQAPHP